MDDYQKQIIGFLKKETGLNEIQLETPPNPEMGDYAFPCFALAKKFRKNPAEISKQLSGDFNKNKKKYKKISKAEPNGAYLNFFIEKGDLTKGTLSEILKLKNKYGSSNLGKGRKIILEHTSINPNAPPHVGRARNAIIGDSIAKILRFQNYKVEVHYFVNDVGKQIALLVLGSKGRKNIAFDDLLEIYIGINKKLEKDKKIEEEALQLLNKLEREDTKVKQKFKRIVDTCIKGQTKLFNELGIKYDVFDYESKYLWSKKTQETLRQLEKTGKLFVDGYNRWVLDQKGYGLGMKIPILVLTRNDGTSLYPLRDLAYNMEKLAMGDNIVILGEDHKLYFEQISAALKDLELKPPRAVHYSFILLQEGKMSTRKGNLVLLGDFMEQAEKKAADEIKKRHNKPDIKSAKIIGHGALKYGIIKVSPEKSVMFSWEQALNFEGDTAPYIQYAYARIQSILKKYNKQKNNQQKNFPKENFFEKLNNPEENELVKLLSEFPDIVEKTAKELRPHLIANYVYNLAQKFNEYYHKHQILKAEDDVKNARIALIKSVAQVIENGLNLLGIEVLKKM